MIRLGITGGIGSGKSFVAHLLESEFAIPVYDCDSRAKQLMVESDRIRHGLTSLVGDEVYLADGSLNRVLMAHYTFTEGNNIEKVNAIVHPEVFSDFNRWAKGQTANIVAVESAILFSSGLIAHVDYSCSVEAPDHVRLARAMSRDSADAETIMRRMKKQDAELGLASAADFHLQNDGLSNLDSQVRRMLSELQL